MYFRTALISTLSIFVCLASASFAKAPLGTNLHFFLESNVNGHIISLQESSEITGSRENGIDHEFIVGHEDLSNDQELRLKHKTEKFARKWIHKQQISLTTAQSILIHESTEIVVEKLKVLMEQTRKDNELEEFNNLYRLTVEVFNKNEEFEAAEDSSEEIILGGALLDLSL